MVSWVSYPSLFTNIVVALSVNIIVLFFFPTLPNLVKSPFHPKDVQPVRSRQVSQPIPNNLYGPEKIYGDLIGVINSTTPLKWEGSCFKDSTAQLELHDTYGIVKLELWKPSGSFCGDHFFFLTSETLNWDYFLTKGKHTVEFKPWKSQSEHEFAEKWGVILLMLPNWPSEPAQESRDM